MGQPPGPLLDGLTMSADTESAAPQRAEPPDPRLAHDIPGESETMYRRIIETANEGILALGPDGVTITFANERMAEMLGLGPDELAGQVLSAFLFEDDLADHAMRMDRRREGAAERYERRLRRADGTAVWAIISAVPIPGDDGTHRGSFAMVTDITDRKRTEDIWREREERYRLVFENVRESLFLLEVVGDGRFRNLEVNPALAQSSGLEREQMIGRTQEEMVPPEVAEQVNAAYQRCAERGEIMEGRRVLDLPAGQRVYDTTLIPVRNRAGTVDRIVGIAHDVTERYRAEEERRASEMQYRALMEQASDAIFVSDANRSYTDVNIAACELLGYSRDELLRLSVADVVPPDANPGQETRFVRMGIGEVVRSERLLRRKDGTLLLAELSTRRLADGRYQAIARDITERKRAEQATARLAAAVEQADEAIVITDPTGTILYVNPSFERVSGYGRDELVGANPRIVKSGRHDAGFYAEMWATLGAGQTWRGTLVNRRKDGVLYEEDSVITPIHDEAGQLVSFVSVKRDVTHERVLEQQLRQAQKMEAIGQLAGGIAHDFNNLITAIRGYSELVRGSLPPGNVRGDIDQVVLAADRAAELTRQLLAFSRRQVLQPRIVRPAEIVDGLAPMLRRLLGEHIELVTFARPDPGRVRVDPSQLEQVIVNLAVNARDAMPMGGRLSIETADADLRDEIAASHDDIPPGRYVVLRVTDTGSGMDEETRAHAFEPFYTTKGVGAGTGMGLATVYGIVKQSGGHVYLYSELERGTSISIYFPRAEPTDGGATSERPSAARGGTETILLVEDEPAVRSFARRALEELGYAVLEARNGEEGIQRATEHDATIDLLVTDVVMPGMGGVRLAEALRVTHPTLRVLLTSGFAVESLRGLDEAAGTSFLAKPFTRESLAVAVRLALEPEA